jgi:hypothetical protein
LLHGARCFELSLVALFMAAGADEAEQQNGEEREVAWYVPSGKGQSVKRMMSST